MAMRIVLAFKHMTQRHPRGTIKAKMLIRFDDFTGNGDIIYIQLETYSHEADSCAYLNVTRRSPSSRPQIK